MHFNFIASDYFTLNALESIKDFVDHYPDFQTVDLSDENELKLLLEIMGIKDLTCFELSNVEFTKYWDLSNYSLPEFDRQQYDKFYEEWIQKSNRDNNMGEYGSLIFLQELTSKWNRLKFRLIIRENNNAT